MIQVSYWNQFLSSAEVLPKMLSFIQIPNSSGFTSRQLGGNEYLGIHSHCTHLPFPLSFSLSSENN
uniref:Uncharacterized protein n=2 Tax=Picea TaxID=3328 RepID=A0A101LXR4_PICGL|nr:hypothetical protein ABT39_MTgene6119 [Picea glauca]QHR92583.1 hypothetical protein Q903MT_gene6629 [Picea sitchensis]